MPRIFIAFLVPIVAFLALHPTASARQFNSAVYYKLGAGERPYKVSTGDFDNDHNLDLAFGDWLSGHVTILLGNGDGTFQKSLRFPDPSPAALSVGDFNEDGNLDLAVAEFGGTGYGFLQIYLGAGNGTFHKGNRYRLGIQSGFLAVADFNDGHLDIAETNGGEDKTPNVMVFLGTGKGTFKKPTTYKLTGGPALITAGDLNGDHHPDLVVGQFEKGDVAVLLNDGTGKFLPPVSYSAGGGEVQEIAIADLRNNGKQDLIVANLSQGMVVLLNKGDGTFGKPTIYVPTCHNCQGPEACVAADFNLDGNLDVACATNFGDSYFFYGKGNGKFGPAIPIKDTINFKGGYSIAAGDFDHDNAPDLAIPIELKGKVATLLNSK